MTDPTPLPDGLTGYFAARAARRAEDVDTVLRGLTEREQALVREAAVMGYVQGTMALPSRGLPSQAERAIPPDSQILAGVITGCLAMPDLYPAIKKAQAEGEGRR